MAITRLMQPFQLKNLQLRNRMVMAPMLSRLCHPNGVVSQKLIDYYVARARGGAGLIICEYCYIDTKESKANNGQLGVYDDQLISGLGDLAEAIQEWGAKTILQICHAGRSTSSRFMGRQPIAPSAMPTPMGEMAREMTIAEIEEIIESFAEAARRAKSAGFDGVELHGTHGYLLAQFLSPLTNHRADCYGMDRGLFALRTLERVRARVGNDYIVGYRMTANESLEGGLTLPEAKKFALRIEEKGIDYIHVSGGTAETALRITLPMYFPGKHLLPLAEGIKSVVRVPVIAVGAIHEPAAAEEALQKNQADLIAMGRALIADPELPNKIKSGRLSDIRTCLRCNDGCISRVRLALPQRCSINAEVGRERQMRLHPAPRSKQVCVIGGGPAGLEAARILALRRHRVTLLEKEPTLGGLVRYASVPDFKAELRSFLAYLKTQVEQCGVEIRRNCPATLEAVQELRPDAVVLAAGATMHRPAIPGADQLFVTQAVDLLAGRFQPGKRVLIVGGAAMGCEIALHLADQGRAVTLVEMLGELAPDLEPRTSLALRQLLQERRVETLIQWKVEKIEKNMVTLISRNWEKRVLETDSVILAMGLAPNRELLAPLQENFREVYAVGDCVEPRKIYQAIHEASFVGRTI
ncbi:MAG: NAD(P)/FAD-dependent oxidoreductase [Deltaproteobacteria bacterium]|nr:NAD(P)/FAD-dependent oxidoreductase [Deltaproteobacteria bacterium]